MSSRPHAVLKLDLAARSDSGLVRRRSTDWGVVNPRMRLAVVAEAPWATATETSPAHEITSAVIDTYGEARATVTVEGPGEASEHLRVAMAGRWASAAHPAPGGSDVAALGAAAFAAGFIVVGRLGRARCFRLRHQALETMPCDDAPTPTPDGPGMELGASKYAPGDVYLLCTDGLWGAVPHESLVSVLALDESADFICDRLVRAALRAGGLDSLAVAVARLT